MLPVELLTLIAEGADRDTFQNLRATSKSMKRVLPERCSAEAQNDAEFNSLDTTIDPYFGSIGGKIHVAIPSGNPRTEAYGRRCYVTETASLVKMVIQDSIPMEAPILDTMRQFSNRILGRYARNTTVVAWTEFNHAAFQSGTARLTITLIGLSRDVYPWKFVGELEPHNEPIQIHEMAFYINPGADFTSSDGLQTLLDKFISTRNINGEYYETIHLPNGFSIIISG